MSNESKVSDLERRVNELEETTKRQFNLTVMGIIVAVSVAVMLNYLITPADYRIGESLILLGKRVHNIAEHVNIPAEQLDAPPSAEPPLKVEPATTAETTPVAAP
ncbi:MAG TPA: hypothetical protein VGE52_14565 [Pirellulales bacterium]